MLKSPRAGRTSRIGGGGGVPAAPGAPAALQVPVLRLLHFTGKGDSANLFWRGLLPLSASEHLAHVAASTLRPCDLKSERGPRPEWSTNRQDAGASAFAVARGSSS